MFDCIVIGFGGIGSAAFFYAAKRGWKVLGIDRFGVAHARGSSHGQTRVIRAAYFEHPNYVPLCQRAFFLWDELQSQCRENIFTRSGLIQIGDPNGGVIKGVRASADEHQLDVENWTAQEAMKRFPIFKIPDEQVAVYEKGAGFLRVERCVANFVRLGIGLGGEISIDDEVVSWERSDSGDFLVTTHSGESYTSKRLIIAAGSWAETLLGLPLGLKVVRKQQHWFQIDRIDHKIENGFPCFLIEQGDECFYGFPEIDYLGMKVAEHSGGVLVQDPLYMQRERDTQELQRTEKFLESRFQFTRRRLVHDSMCMYTKSPDEHFLIDHHPDHERLVFAAGLSGHGFKFAPVIGLRLVDMLDGKQDELFDFFRLNRILDKSSGDQRSTEEHS